MAKKKAGPRPAALDQKVVRKLRAGMMPPAGSRRPDKAGYRSFIGSLEAELDRNAPMHVPPPGLHRLNRTEYANVIRDLLDLEIDPSAYLPSDDSTHGFDNIAGALGISVRTVRSDIAGVLEVLGVQSRFAAGMRLRLWADDA